MQGKFPVKYCLHVRRELAILESLSDTYRAIMDQFSKLIAKVNFQMKTEGTKGRSVNVKIGDIFLVTNPRHMQDKGIKIDRKNKAYINSGYLLELSQIEQLFDVEK